MSALATISVSMHVRCKQCQCSIQLGAIVEHARCHKCGHLEQLPPERWRRFLDEAINDGPSLTDPEKQLRFDDDDAWIITRNERPTCAACQKPLPENAAQNGRTHGKCFCVACGGKIGVRPVPAAFAGALPRVTHLLGEDGTQMKTPDVVTASDPNTAVSFRCPDCGGNIQPDGSSRAVRCPYCNVVVVLSQPIWSRLHTGKNDPHKFYLVHDSSLPKPLGRADIDWLTVDDVVCDATGNVYILTEDDDDARMVVALDRQLKTRWAAKNLATDDDGGIAWRNDDVLFVWSPQRYSAILLRARDGEMMGKVGGEQPPHMDRHILDLGRTRGLDIDFDGTILFSKHRRLVRCAPDGTGQFTWPPGQGFLGGIMGEKLHPFTSEREDGASSLEEAGDRPTNLYDLDIKIGWDGKTYLRESSWIACYDRMGKRLWAAEVDRDHGSVNDFGIDARGIVYVLCSTESYTSSVHRIMPGGQIGRFIDGRLPQTPIREERYLAVHPEGNLFLCSSGRRMRVYAPDGRCLFASEKAKEEDVEHAQRLAKARDGDRVR